MAHEAPHCQSRSGQPARILSLTCIALGLVGNCWSEAASPARSTDTRPNIILIFADDHATQALSAYGDERRLVGTPNIDRLAREGMLFERCLVPNSICGPSRATVLTGKYAHRHGFYNNGTIPFDGSQQTVPKLLRQAGYQTALIGKWHLISDPTGFDYWDILPGQGVYYNPPMIRNGERVNRQGYVTDVIIDLSLEWLKQRDPTKPFLLMTQHKAPHRPWSPAIRHLGWDHDRHHPEPETLFDDYGNGRGLAWRDQEMMLAEAYNNTDAKLLSPRGLNAGQRKAWDDYYKPRNAEFLKATMTDRDRVRWIYQRYMHDYLGCVKAVDEGVGRLLEFLDDSGLATNTVVLYSSDQGFFLGEHGWFDKRWILEESLRTPLLIRWPGVTQPGSRCERIVSLLDLAQTFLDIAGQPQPSDMQGRSLVPLLRGAPPEDWRTSFYYHYYEYPVWHKVRPHYGVVTDRYKLVHFYKPDVDDWELYDRRVDPLEMRNFIGDPDYADTIAELKLELSRLRSELSVPAIEQEPRQAYGRYPLEGPGVPPDQVNADWLKPAGVGLAATSREDEP